MAVLCAHCRYEFDRGSARQRFCTRARCRRERGAERRRESDARHTQPIPLDLQQRYIRLLGIASPARTLLRDDPTIEDGHWEEYGDVMRRVDEIPYRDCREPHAPALPVDRVEGDGYVPDARHSDRGKSAVEDMPDDDESRRWIEDNWHLVEGFNE